MRVDRFLSEATGMSRKEATRTLHREEVEVNGRVEKKGAAKIKTTDEVTWNGVKLELMGPTYLMMNKPAGCVCANDDPTHLPVLSYLELPNLDKVHTVGRLDLDTTGLLLITNDGQWSHRITSPKRKCAKVYRAWLADPVEESYKEAFQKGIQLNGEQQLTAPAEVEFVNEQEVLVTLYEGKYHQVKRMFAALGNKVEALHREQVGELKLDPELQEGEYRALTAQEVALF
ncbi:MULTISPECIES: 16S rRNA pseudouridine(516) synthase RsuA [Gammaproteobacteria]|uniref:16S rRNA pseudouridine(516) synthase RsuA n=1 Tax=Gammaproteobacteria TaxID=1236 RepID=UPI000DD0C533|nr:MULTISPECIES: 16S rRNA pseudouridine(516) synthase RsuA [Gammaproteobacteria]RTE87734.1 16S rRNA pseudouridine(516) synthase RsuA [Aliidiomarina sp. B3213]TCZ92484.1 16S rRNA pseudouridine(516) synthase RsuA [Lysobacter sp. N42]